MDPGRSMLMIPGQSSVTIGSQSDASNLTSCDTFGGSVTIASSASGTITLNNVEEIQGSFTVESGSGITGLVAPDLETLKGGMILDGLDALTNVEMSSLSQASSLTITGNPKLKHIMFDQLEEVNGELKLTGSFASVSLPSLDQVNGQTTIQGGSSMSCSALDSLQSEGVYRGAYSCSSDGSGDSLSAGAKAGIAIAVIVVVVLILVVVWFVIRRRRQQRNNRTQSISLETPVANEKDEKPPQVQQLAVPDRELKPPMPRKPVGVQAAQLDGRSIYEASSPMTPSTVYHELDAGPVLSSHQRPIHSEA
ncbi:hypothetical protein N7532_000836 [Penicillium argentinense]|uniref:Receptor L-domain domain-containing protein n=1 Tax=Penicillium argentinense TaxID=1131581 RepID=A0A9W9G685_9EURO|nr:uncharacterized protein N7532_000836 [Penicillium argentinense]KAJ5112791.1 hypothetical protein N7532_000836 [Penicillium argentinense]